MSARTIDFLFIALVLAGFWLVWLARHSIWKRKRERDLESRALLGAIRDWEVRLAADPRTGELKIGISILPKDTGDETDRFFALLGARQARQLADWLRVAAAPGKTVELARASLGQRKRAA